MSTSSPGWPGGGVLLSAFTRIRILCWSIKKVLDYLFIFTGCEGVKGRRGGGRWGWGEGDGGSVAHDCLVQQFTVKEAHIRKAVPNDGRYIFGLGVHRVPGFVLKVQDEVLLTQMKMIRVRCLVSTRTRYTFHKKMYATCVFTNS